MLEAYKVVAERLLDQLSPDGAAAIAPRQPLAAHVEEFAQLVHGPDSGATPQIQANVPLSSSQDSVGVDGAPQALPKDEATNILTQHYDEVTRPPVSHLTQALNGHISNPQAMQLLTQTTLQLQTTGMLSQAITQSLDKTVTQFGRLS